MQAINNITAKIAAGMPDAPAAPAVVTPKVVPSAAPANTASQAISEQALQKALDQANQAMAEIKQGIGFSYEKRLNQLFVQVKDKTTGEVIKEFPPKALIEHRVAMREFIGLILDQKI